MIVLVRHGESEWNASDRFTGWADVPLTATGRAEARSTGRWLRAKDVVPTLVHTSLLDRARTTAALVVEECGDPRPPVVATALLNERHYGALQGLVRSEAVERFGADQVARWRRTEVDLRPPPDGEGRGESLADLRARLTPYVDEMLLPAARAGQVVLVVTHGNPLRLLVQRLQGLGDRELAGLEHATGQALLFDGVSELRRVG